ncbi:MAG: tRNA epoxyqueuosine(34) reductase QueG, partial [cyanobacterium endosymbiont of Rhopalodia inflata]
MNTEKWTETIKQKILELGFHKVGIANIDSQFNDTATTHLKRWLALGYHADMAWMFNPKRLNIRDYMPQVKSVICVALNYYTPH